MKSLGAVFQANEIIIAKSLDLMACGHEEERLVCFEERVQGK